MTTAAEAAEVMTMMMTTTTTTTTITSSSKQTSYFEIKVLLLYLTVFGDMYIAWIQLNEYSSRSSRRNVNIDDNNCHNNFIIKTNIIF
jgi:hypothetical protein